MLWLAILVAFFRTVFARTSAIAGWNEPQYFFFVGCFFAMNGLIEMLFLDNCNEFAELVRTGDLDGLLLKPIDEQFLITCRRIDWGCAPNILMGSVLMVIALVQMHWQFDAVALDHVSGHGRLWHGHRLQLHAALDVDLGVDGAQPEPDGDVVAVFERGPLSQGDLRGPAGPSRSVIFSRTSCRSWWSSTCRPIPWCAALDPPMVGLIVVAAVVLLWLSRRFFQYALRSYRSASS